VLRAVVIAIAAALVSTGAALLACGIRVPGWQSLTIGLVVLVGTVFERWRYRRVEPPAQGPWQRTGEQFLDPTSDRPVEVMFDPRTGERRYVAGRGAAADDVPSDSGGPGS